MIDYLKQRGLKSLTSKTKEELIAIVFTVGMYKEHFPIKPSPVEEKSQKEEDYRRLYSVSDEGALVDPLQKKDGWQGSREGIHRWPSISISDITVYLMSRKDPNSDLRERLVRDYKERKAYSYMESTFLGKLFYHPVAKDLKYCFLKSSCRPCQRITCSDDHQVWVLAKKGDSGLFCALIFHHCCPSRWHCIL